MVKLPTRSELTMETKTDLKVILLHILWPEFCTVDEVMILNNVNEMDIVNFPDAIECQYSYIIHQKKIELIGVL